MKPLQIEGARTLADAGAITHVRLVASAEGLRVEINRTFAVANRTKQTRFFAKADTCFSWLREMGISQIHEVDLTHWGAEEKSAIRMLSRVLALPNFIVSSVIGTEWERLTKRVESLSKKGRHAEAILVGNEALQLAEDSLKPDDPDIAVLLNSLAMEHHALEQFEQAEPLYKRALAITEKALGPDAPLLGWYLNSLAEVYDAQGRSDQTEPMYLRALKICEKDTESDKSIVAIVLTNLASLYARQNSYVQAEQLCERALEIWKDKSGLLVPMPTAAVMTFDVLAELYRKTGRDEEAAPLEKRADVMWARQR